MKKLLAVLLSIITIASLPITVFAEFENNHKNSGDAKSDMTAIALTQVGFTDSKENSKYTQNGKASSLAFIEWCASQAEIADEIILQTSSLSDFYAFFAYGNKVKADPEYKPQSGDIMFFGTEKNVESTAIVTDSDDDYVTAVIYDTDLKVKKKQYSRSLERIIGYATPDYDVKQTFITGKHKTTASFLNFRSQPTTSSSVIYQIPMGTIVEVTEISGEWGKITYKDATGWINMQYAVPYDDSHTDVTDYSVEWNVIDVSKWQGKIDWSKIANANIQGVILRIGLRATKTRELFIDDKFLEYYNGAKKEGLHIGCYFYSAAKTTDDVREEAEFILDTIEKNSLEFDMPVYLDLEENMTYNTGRENVRRITETFLDVMNEANIYSGIYCYRSWAQDCYTDDMFKDNPLWIAEYSDKCTYGGSYGMWQYTSKGSVSGIEENYTDLNICYVNYPKLISDLGFNKQINHNGETKKGDVNGDGKLTAADARLALRISAKLEANVTDKMMSAADADGNGTVTAADARIILRVSAGLQKF